MTRNNPTQLGMVAVFSALTTFLLVRAFAPDHILATSPTSDTALAGDEAARGPHGGRLLEEDNFAIEAGAKSVSASGTALRVRYRSPGCRPAR